MNNFFDGLENSSAFGYTLDDNGKLIPVQQVNYSLWDAEYFPFVVLGDELQSLNDYCYIIKNAIQSEFEKAIEDVDAHKCVPKDFNHEYHGFTPHEVLLGLEQEMYKWQWLKDITATHLIILLYAYLEKTLKYICRLFFEEGIIKTKRKSKDDKLSNYISIIADADIENRILNVQDKLNLINEARKIRNNFAHDNLEGFDLDEEADYIYDNRALVPPFKLIVFIDAIANILKTVEEIWQDHMKSERRNRSASRN
jgi:hypothetical protein